MPLRIQGRVAASTAAAARVPAVSPASTLITRSAPLASAVYSTSSTRMMIFLFTSKGISVLETWGVGPSVDRSSR